MIRLHGALFSLLSAGLIAGVAHADSPERAPADSKSPYAYATNGVIDTRVDRSGVAWKLLLDKSNLGGKELEAAEVTLPGGTQVGSHLHGSVEIIYVLDGVYGHEVNGKLYLLKAGMIGIVRPGDHVRHLVPKSGPAKLLIVWAPPGEAAKIFRDGGPAPAPVAEARSLDSIPE